MNNLFKPDGPLFSFLTKVGQMILLSMAWLVVSVPIITLAASTTALYYAVIKCIRREYGSAMQEFWKSFRANLKRGIPASVIMFLFAAILLTNITYLTQVENGKTNLLLWGSVFLMVLLLGCAAYICPVLSRFSMKLSEAIRLSFVISLRFFPLTVLLLAGTALLGYIQLYILPIPTILILPALWAYVVTFPMEKVLRKYMPPKEENDDAWYYQ